MWVVFALHRDMHVKRRVFGDDSFELLLGHACEIRVKLGVFVVVALRKCFCGGATSFLSPMAFFDFLIYTIHYIQYIWIHLTYIVPNSIQSASCGCCYCFLTFKASFLCWVGERRASLGTMPTLCCWFLSCLPLFLLRLLFSFLFLPFVMLCTSFWFCYLCQVCLPQQPQGNINTKPPEPRAQKVTKATDGCNSRKPPQSKTPEPKNREGNSTWHPTKQTSLSKKQQKHERPLCICLIIRDNHRSVSAVYLFYVTSVSESIEKKHEKNICHDRLQLICSSHELQRCVAVPAQRCDDQGAVARILPMGLEQVPFPTL